MRRIDKLKNIEEVNKKLLGENRVAIKEGYNFNDANNETANKLAQIIMSKHKDDLHNIIQALSKDEEIMKIKKDDHDFGSAELGLALGLVVQKIVMNSF